MLSRTVLILSDICAFFVAFLCAYIVREAIGDYEKNFDATVSSLWWTLLIVLIAFAYEGLYTKKRPFWMETRFILKALTIAFLTIFAIASIGKINDNISRLVIIMMAIFGLFLFPIFRILFKKFAIPKEPVVIIGYNKTAISCAKALMEDSYLGYEVLCFLDDTTKTVVEINGHKLKVLKKIRNISKLAYIGVQTAIVAPNDSSDTWRDDFKFAHKYMKHIIFAPDSQGLPLANTEPFFLFEQDIFLLKVHNNLESKTSQLAKRTFDLLLALCLLPILLITIAIIALLIKNDSSGPIFYAHKRIGQDGRSFSIYKFRSMYKDSKERLEKILKTDPVAKKEWNMNFKLKNDPRITKIGAILRKTSLDELPQIFNVLRGDMSFVGPRPVLRQEIDEHYKDSAVYYMMVKPGITGLWQVTGRSDTTYAERVKLDVGYVTNWSLWLDIVILIKTFKAALKQDGAY